MSTSFFSQVSIQDVIASMKTLGFLTGIAVSLLVVVLVAIFDFWRGMHRRRSLLTIAVDDQGSEFKISLRAIKTHLKCYLSQVYPQLSLQDIRLCRRRRGVQATVTVLARCGQDMHGLSESVMADLQNSLNGVMGMKDLFTRVDVVINGLTDEKDASFKPAANDVPPEQQESPTAEPEQDAEATVLKAPLAPLDEQDKD